jgi:hypothetical protein
VFVEAFNEIVDGLDGEAEVGVFIMSGGLGGSADDVELAFGADAEPGMAAIMKRLGNCVKTDYLLIETRTFFEVDDVEGDVIELRHIFFLLSIYVAKAGKQDCYDEGKSFHSNKSIQNIKTEKGQRRFCRLPFEELSFDYLRLNDFR